MRHIDFVYDKISIGEENRICRIAGRQDRQDKFIKQVRLNIYKKFLALFAIFHAQLLGRVYRHCPRHFA
jgi:hypothetical protein